MDENSKFFCSKLVIDENWKNFNPIPQNSSTKTYFDLNLAYL